MNVQAWRELQSTRDFVDRCLRGPLYPAGLNDNPGTIVARIDQKQLCTGDAFDPMLPEHRIKFGHGGAVSPNGWKHDRWKPKVWIAMEQGAGSRPSLVPQPEAMRELSNWDTNLKSVYGVR